MANVALIKLFTGLTLPTAQLSGELRRAGHRSRVIYFKEYLTRPVDAVGRLKITDHPGMVTLVTGAGAQKYVWNCYEPITETEYELLVGELRDFGAEAVGFTVHSGIIAECAEVSARLKRELGVPILWGGPGVTLEPERCMPHADVICVGEGEEVIVEVAERLQRGDDLRGIDGTWCRLADGSIQKNARRAIGSLDDIAIPNWRSEDYCHIEANRRDAGMFMRSGHETQYIVMTQRGCPFSCAFCIESRYQEMFGKKNSLRRRNPELVLEELRWAKENLPIESVWFWDDVFTINPSWHDEFLPRYREEIGLPFWCYTYPTTHNLELLKKLKAAGCSRITMGVQSGSRRVLTEYFNRPTKHERTIRAAEEIVEAGITCNFDLITRNHVETEADLRETFEFLLDFPREMKSMGFVDMMSFPTYGYTETVAKMAQAGLPMPNASLGDDDYAYYHKLFSLTRTDLPREEILALANDPEIRRHHHRLDPYLANIDVARDMAEYATMAPLTEEVRTGPSGEGLVAAESST